MTDAVGVRAEGVVKRFGDGPDVLGGVDLAVEPGAILALLGPSGCGKTTLLRIIAGLERPDEGVVVVGADTFTGGDVWVPPEQRSIGLVFQEWALFPHLSVARNVGFGLPRSQRRGSEQIDEALALVGLSEVADRMPDTLSGGQQQRVALARAIAPRPSVLLLDEPFSNLDAALRARVRTEIHRLLVELGITTVFVTHDQDEAFVLGDMVAVLCGGQVVQHGTPSEIYLRPATRWLAHFVGEANVVSGVAGGSTATTVFGTVTLQRPTTGPVEVVVRPEQLDVEPITSTAAESDQLDAGGVGWVEGTVTLVEFLGHSTSYVVDLGTTTVTARRRSAPVVQRGDRARLRYSGDPLTWFDSIAEG